MGAGPVLIENYGLPWEFHPAVIIGKNGDHYLVETEDDIVKAPYWGHSLLEGKNYPVCCGQVHGTYQGSPVPIFLRVDEEIGWVLRSDYEKIIRVMS